PDRCVLVARTHIASPAAGGRGRADDGRLTRLEFDRVSYSSLRVSPRDDLTGRPAPAVHRPRRSSRSPRRPDAAPHAACAGDRWVRDPLWALPDRARPRAGRAVLRRLSHGLPHLRLPSFRDPSHEATHASRALPAAPAHAAPFRDP